MASHPKGRKHRLGVLEERGMQGIFELKREEVMEGSMKKLHNLYFSPNTCVIKSKRMRLVGMHHVWERQEIRTELYALKS
jgi:hypothetical protein